MCKVLTDEQAESVVGGRIEIKENHRDRTTTIKLTELDKEYVVNQPYSDVFLRYNYFKAKNRGNYAIQSDYEKAFESFMRSKGWI